MTNLDQISTAGFRPRDLAFRVRMAKVGLFCVALAFAIAAFGQEVPKGSRIISPAAVVEERPRGVDPRLYSRQVLEEFAKCLVISRRRDVEKILAAPSIGPDSANWSKDLNLDACLSPAFEGYVSLKLEPALLRGAVFKILYARDRRDPPRANTGTQTVFTQPDWAADVATANAAPADTNVYIVMRKFATCIALAKPAAVHALLLAKAGEKKEDAAFANITPAVSGCVPDGQKLTISKNILVGLLAETAYRIRATEP